MKLYLAILGLFFLSVLSNCGGHDPEPGPGPKPPVPTTTSVKIGTPEVAGQSYKWSPVAGLSDPFIAQPQAMPKCTTIYEVSATNQCGVAKSSVTVHVFKKNSDGELVEVKCMDEATTTTGEASGGR